jgi:intracellular sulfur oxidation DsrE/DsrF family protein
MKRDELSDEYLNAFVDNELAPVERARALEQITADTQLKKQVCELNMLKEMVRSSYHRHELPHDSAKHRRWPYVRHAVAACCLMVVGALAGWLGHGRFAPYVAGLDVVSLHDVVANTDRLVVHVDTASPEIFDRALTQTEKLLADAKLHGRNVQLHLAANSKGLDLFRVSTSPYAQRIAELKARYPNLTLIGCGQTISRLRERNQDVTLLPEVTVVSAVLDEVVDDLQDGWTYIKV